MWLWTVSYLGFLDLVCPPVKSKTSSKVVGQDTGPRAGGAVLGHWIGVVGSILPGDSRTTSALSTVVWVVGPSVAFKGGNAVWGLWVSFKRRCLFSDVQFYVFYILL